MGKVTPEIATTRPLYLQCRNVSRKFIMLDVRGKPKKTTQTSSTDETNEKSFASRLLQMVGEKIVNFLFIPQFGCGN